MEHRVQYYAKHETTKNIYGYASFSKYTDTTKSAKEKPCERNSMAVFCCLLKSSMCNAILSSAKAGGMHTVDFPKLRLLLNGARTISKAENDQGEGEAHFIRPSESSPLMSLLKHFTYST